jgi:BirA family biotin operon repressor/biotin-[acetyl-CoA-carboxylase] ligase
VSAASTPSRLGNPRLHLRCTDSTNDRARALAAAGAPHGTLVTAGEQRAGRGRQGRTWSAPPGRALLASLVLREVPALLAIASAVAVAEAVSPDAAIKWPNDILLAGRKVAGILAEGRHQEGWAVLGIGVNVAVREHDLPPQVAAAAAGRGLEPAPLEPPRERDALLGREVRWQHGRGVAAGIDGAGRLLVDRAGGVGMALDAGEVHLVAPGGGNVAFTSA